MMKRWYKKISQCIALVLVISVLAPSVVKITDVLHHHHHEFCKIDVSNDTHLHKLCSDCEFDKFKLVNSYHFPLDYSEVIVDSIDNNLIDHYRSFLFPYKQYISYLRGPPQLT